VRLGSDEHPNRRSADQAVVADVPADASQDGLAGGRQRGDVGHLRARDQPDAGLLGQPKQRPEPVDRDGLDRRGRRRRDRAERVLVPRAGEPVGRQRGRQRAAGDEAEVARAGRGDEPAVEVARQVVDHLLRRDPRLG
jgi:hypothetical protein